MSKIKLLKEFASNPNEIGIIFPSSDGLGRMITSEIGIEKAASVAEIGPGTAVFTRYIMEKLPKEAKYFAVEKNSELCALFNKKFPSLKIYNDDAANLGRIACQEGISGLDVVVSGLPWSLFPVKLQLKIMKAVSASLVNGGRFTTYAYIQGTFLPGGIRLKKMLCKYFSKVECSRVVWLNIPPAFVYRCTK